MQDYVAVGCPLGQYSRTGESEPPEVVAIYDIKTGAKKKSLSLGKVVQKTGGRFRDPANQSLVRLLSAFQVALAEVSIAYGSTQLHCVSSPGSFIRFGNRLSFYQARW